MTECRALVSSVSATGRSNNIRHFYQTSSRPNFSVTVLDPLFGVSLISTWHQAKNPDEEWQTRSENLLLN